MPSFAKSVSTASPVERRSCGRRRIDGVTYADLGADNGAILVNLSEGGLCFQSVAPLELGQTVILKFKAPGGEHLESRAKVAWLNESGKSGGLRFVELSEDARAQVRAWTDEESAAEPEPEIHQADTSTDSTSTEKRSSPEDSQPGPMREIRGPKSTLRATAPVQMTEAPAHVASARTTRPVHSEIHDTASAAEAPSARVPTYSSAVPIPGKELASTGWRDHYLTAIRESDPEKLPQRLVAAQKAILLRVEVLRDAPENVHELQALRRALNSLYALEPNKSLELPQIAEDQGDYEGRQRNWMKLVSAVALAAVFSFATGWILARKNSGNDAQNAGTAGGPKGNITTSDNVIAGVRQVYILDTPPQQLSTPPQNSGANSPLPKTPDHPSVAENMRVQQEANERSVDVVNAKDHGAPSVNGQTRQAANRSLQSTTEGRPRRPAENPAAQAPVSLASQPEEAENTHRLVSIPPKAAPEVRAELQSSPPPSIPSIEDQPKATEVQWTPPGAQQPISRGVVTVSLSNYPSLRVPPELRSQAVAAKLQIGQVVSRVDPIYPAEAEQQRVEGTVKLHPIIGTDGSVRDIEGVSGPPALVPAVLSAVRQWRYQPTLLAGQPVETGQDVTIVFRLVKDAASAN
jgi:TonB family protein